MSDVSLADLRTQSAAAEPAVKALTSTVTGLSGGLSTMARGAGDATSALTAHAAAQRSLLQMAGALSKAQLDAGAAARQQADNVVSLDTAHRQAAASATGAATAMKKVGGEAKVSASQIAGLVSSTVDLASGLASGTQPLVTTLTQVIELAGGLGEVFAALEVGGAAATLALAPWIAGLAAVAAGVWAVVHASEEHEKRLKTLNDRIAAMNKDMAESYPTLVQSTDGSNLAAEGTKNFQNWLDKTNGSLETHIKLLREASIADSRLAVWNAQANRDALEGETFRTVHGAKVFKGDLNPFNDAKEQAEKLRDLAAAQKAVDDATKILNAKLDAPPSAFGAQATQATKAVQKHTEAIELQNDVVTASNVVWPEAAAIAAAYKVQQDAVTEAQRGTIQTMQEVIGEAPHFSTAIESMAIEAERLAGQASDVRSGIEQFAHAIHNNDFTGAFVDLLGVLAKVEKAFAKGSSAADKFSALAGIAQGVGSVIGGRTGAALSGAASGAMAGMTLGGAPGAVVGAALGGLTSFLGASAAKAEAKLEALRKSQADFQAAQLVSSNSVVLSLDEASRYQNKDLQYSNDMLRALRSIDNQIGAAAASLASQISGGSLFSSSGLGAGTTSSMGGVGGALGGGLVGGALGAAAGVGLGAAVGAVTSSLFGFAAPLTALAGPLGLAVGAVGLLVGALTKTKTTTEILDQGLQFSATTLGQVNAGGLQGQTYADLVSTTKKSFAGLNYSTKVRTSTQMGALDPSVLAQITGVVSALGSAVQSAASIFGVAAGEAAQTALESATIDLGKLSLKGLSAEEIEKVLNATFARVGDDLANTAVPALKELQLVGEGALQTLVRVATEYKAVDTVLQSMGKAFGADGVASIALRHALVDGAGGLDEFANKVSFYTENFLTEGERLAPIQASVTAQLKSLSEAYGDTKIKTLTTVEGFKDLVQHIELTSQAGVDLFNAMLNLAPAFYKVAQAADATGAMLENPEVANRRKSIQDDIDQLTLKPAELIKRQRAEEMAATVKLDASLGPLLQQFYDLSDAADAAAAATKLANDRRSLEIQLLEAQGRSVEAVAAKRQLELAALDPSLRPIQQAVYNAQDAAAAVTSARDVLTKAYQRESAALQATSDKFKVFAANLAKFRDSLDTGPLAQLSPGDQYQASRSAFEQTAALARLGNEDALGSLQSVSEAYLGVSRSAAATAVDYQRDLASVKIAVEAAGDTATRTASVADKQLEALNASVAGLIAIDNSVISVAAAVNNLQGALNAARSAGVTSVGGVAIGGATTGSGSGVYVDPVPTSGTTLYNPNQSGQSNWDWIMTHTMAGQVNAGDPAFADVYASAAKYKPGFNDIASVYGLAEAQRQYAAGLVGFARGGAFSNGVVLRPTAFNLAQMGEAGPEAIMPLTMGPNGLGVRAAGGSSDSKELRDLKAEVANLNVALMTIAENTGATARMQRRWDGDGLPAERNVA